MKKFSMNLLKVGLFLILGLCVSSITTQVKAASVLRTYYAYAGDEITVEASTPTNSIGTGYNAVTLKDCVTDGASIGEKNGTKVKVKLSTALKARTSYYMWATNTKVNEIYIMPEYMISPYNSNGHNRIYSTNSSPKTYDMTAGNEIQLEIYTKDANGGLLKQNIKLDLNGNTNTNNRRKEYSTKFEVIKGADKVSIDQDGKLKALKAGDATVKFTRTICDERPVDNNYHKAWSTLTSVINIKVKAATPKPAPEKTVTSITVSLKPGAKTYYVGDTLKLDDLMVYAKYSDGTDGWLTQDDISVSYDFSKSGDREVTVYYRVKAGDFKYAYVNVNVKAKSSGGSGSDSNNNNNNNNNNSSVPKALPKYNDGTEVKVGDCVKMTKGSQWNVYTDSSVKTKKDHLIKKADGLVYTVEAIENTNSVKLSQNGKEIGWIKWYNTDAGAKNYFSKVTEPADNQEGKPADDSKGDEGAVSENNLSSSLSSLNFGGIIGKVFEIIKQIIQYITNNIIPVIKPLAQELISGLTQ